MSAKAVEGLIPKKGDKLAAECYNYVPTKTKL